jgi:GxxExxY protein
VRLKPQISQINTSDYTVKYKVMEDLLTINKITSKIIGAAFKIHSDLGPGLLENPYKECLYHLLSSEGLLCEKEKAMPFIYQSIKLDIGYRIDLFVENRVVVEVKAVEALTDVHTAQVLTYLKLSNSKVGLLINFNVEDLKKGIRRLIL